MSDQSAVFIYSLRHVNCFETLINDCIIFVVLIKT